MPIKLAQLEAEITVNDTKAKATVLDFERTARHMGDSAKNIQGSFKSAASEISNLVSLFTEIGRAHV